MKSIVIRWKQTSVDQWGLTLYTLPPSGVRIWKWMRLNHQILLFQIPSQIGSPFCLSYGPAWWPIMSGNLDCKLQLHRDLTLWTSFSKHLSIAGSMIVDRELFSFCMLNIFFISVSFTWKVLILTIFLIKAFHKKQRRTASCIVESNERFDQGNCRQFCLWVYPCKMRFLKFLNISQYKFSLHAEIKCLKY